MNKRQKKKYINRDSYPAKKVFLELLEKEHVSSSGWKLSKVLIDEWYDKRWKYFFYNRKEQKAITLLYNRYTPEKNYEITVYDPFHMIDEHIHMDSIVEALHYHCQGSISSSSTYYLSERNRRRYKKRKNDNRNVKRRRCK